MSTWINSGPGVAILCLTLAACVPGLPEPATTSSRSLSVMDGAIRVAAAPGYCADLGASRETDTQATVIFGRCSDRPDRLAAIVTVSVRGPGSAGILATGAPALAEYLASPEGLAALSRDGDAASVRLRAIHAVDDRLIVHLDDAVTGETWRTLIGLRGRLVSISVTGTGLQDRTGAAGRALLDRSAAAMIRANPVLR